MGVMGEGQEVDRKLHSPTSCCQKLKLVVFVVNKVLQNNLQSSLFIGSQESSGSQSQLRCPEVPLTGQQSHETKPVGGVSRTNQYQCMRGTRWQEPAGGDQVKGQTTGITAEKL